jgi:uncharacterized spore protein YtfJ
MSDFDPNQMVNDILAGMSKVGEALQVIREPIHAGDKVIIPALVARVGAGGGSGRRPGEVDGADGRPGSGGGGGGGMTISPVFLIVDAQGERLITVPGAFDSASNAIETLVDAVGAVFSRGRRGQPAGDETA